MMNSTFDGPLGPGRSMFAGATLTVTYGPGMAVPGPLRGTLRCWRCRHTSVRSLACAIGKNEPRQD